MQSLTHLLCCLALLHLTLLHSGEAKGARLGVVVKTRGGTRRAGTNDGTDGSGITRSRRPRDAVVRSDWSYTGDHGPDHWGGECQSGKSQSPIEVGSPTKKLWGPALVLDGAYRRRTYWNATWNGHAYAANMVSSNDIALMYGGSLEDAYIFMGLHVHWGAEHTVKGKRYDGEMHLVHYNSKYTQEEAMKKSDGLAVLGILLEEDENVHTSVMSDFVEDITKKDHDDDIKFTLSQLLPDSITPWVRYEGSLTTPDCSENVKWSVLLNPVKVKKGLIKELEEKTGPSYRPIQPINERTIYLKTEVLSLTPNNSFGPPLTSSLSLLLVAAAVALLRN